MPAVVTDDAFRSAGRSGCVEDVERVLGANRYAIARFGTGDEVLPVGLAVVQFARTLGALQHHPHGRYVLRQCQRLIEHRLVVHNSPGLEPATGGENGFRRGVIDTCCHLRTGKAAKHHGMHGTDTRAGQHREDGLRDHRHINKYPIAPADTGPLQCTGECRHGVAQPPIAVALFSARHRTVENQRRALAPGALGMPVDRVVAGIELAARKPATGRPLEIDNGVVRA